MSIMSTLSISDEKNNEGNGIPLRTRETNTFPVANSSPSLSHENNKVSTNVNYFSMSRSEAQATIPGVDSALCPSFARIEEMGMEATQNPVEVNPASQKKKRKSGKKKKPDALQNSGQPQQLPEECCLTSSLSDVKNNDGNDIPLGTTETITFPVANSSQSLSHENNEVSTNVNYFSMSRSEAQVTIPGVDSALCPSFARIEEMGMEATPNSVEVNPGSQKKKRKGGKKKKPDALQNSGQPQQLPEERCLTLSLSDAKNNEGNVIPLGTGATNTFPVTNSSPSLSHENHEVSTNVNYFSMSRSEAQVTVPGVDSALCPSFAGIEEMGMEVTQNPVEVNPGSQKKKRKSGKKKKPNALQNSGQPQQLPEECCLRSTNHMNITSTLGLSDERNSEEKVISLGTDEANAFSRINSSQSLSHENNKHFSNANIFLMTKSEVQDTIPGVDSTLCPSFARINQCRETTRNHVEANPVCKKKKREKNRKKKPDSLQNGGQTQKLLEEGCPSITNHMNILSTVSPLDERNTEEKVILLGTGETNSLSVTNSSVSLSHESSKVFSNTNSLPMTKNEMQDTTLGVDSIMCPPFDRIDQVGVETTKNPVEADMVIKKKKKSKGSRKKKLNTLHNSGQPQNLAEDGCPTSISDMNIMPIPSLCDEKNSEEKIFASAADKVEQVCVAVIDEEDKSSKLSHISLVRAPVGHLRKKLLILDLNGLLADIVQPAPKNYKPDFKFAERAIFKRPFCQDFLKFCFERFEDLSYCTPTKFKTLAEKHKFVVFKELRRIWEKHDRSLPWVKGDYNESNTLLLDDSPYKALLNPLHTAIFPYSFKFQNKSDNSLGAGGDLRVYLEGLAMAENVQEYVKQNPFGQRAITQTSENWEFYQRVINSLGSLPTRR
uniref:FCP1 homology domain-containing protein n=1 Tax=Fagus sylvatica TaxID=28930 RepID=A0A2N9IN16_FAGSY